MGASKRRPPEILKFDKKNVPHTGPVMNPIHYTHIIVCTVHTLLYMTLFPHSFYSCSWYNIFEKFIADPLYM